ncbi:hypothetical protein AJ78_02486 [Emergomyces pasteurianus Ep9510]|uniref:BZIP domain-containing protein n=1 Tax=Emergomyces pasteurianus Ep9510 TaxID=1447872 RepID=A0A1J9PMS3_9EURO|nr:hypothetical protein AJ78_02486 [Emergomyces pasteurianus Ep9510]
MSAPTNNDLPKSQKSRDHTLARVRNNQRRCRERRRQYIATLEQKVEETERLLDEARVEIDSLKAELRACRSDHSGHIAHPHRRAGKSVESLTAAEGGLINSTTFVMSFGEQGGYTQVSGYHEEGQESPVPLQAPVSAVDDLVAAACHHQKTADIEYNLISDSLALQPVDNTPSKQLYSSYPALVSPREASVRQCTPADATISEIGLPITGPAPELMPTAAAAASPAPGSLSTVSTPTLTSLQLQGLTLPTLPAVSNCLNTAAQSDESTTPCSQAFVFISQQNFRGIDASVIERWLSRGFRQAIDPREGCRVENNLLFQLLDFISDR